MSKSLGNGIDPYELIQEFGVDKTRFFMAREVILGQDGDFSRTSFIALTNSHLANDLGNLCQRVLSMVYKNCGGCVPECGAIEPEDEALLTQAIELYGKVYSLLLETQEIQKYCETLWGVIRSANKYVDMQAPWTLKKTDTARMQTVLYVLLETFRYIGILLQPLVPEAANKLLNLLSVPMEKRSFASLKIQDSLKPGTALPKLEALFPRFIEEEK
jgi:methionyl-tRNA synthetase